jgi:hypothetical protein
MIFLIGHVDPRQDMIGGQHGGNNHIQIVRLMSVKAHIAIHNTNIEIKKRDFEK